MKQGCFEDKEDSYNREPELEDCDAAEIISTDIFGKLYFWSAETLLPNGGRSTLSTKLRFSRFKGDAFVVSYYVRIYNQHGMNAKVIRF